MKFGVMCSKLFYVEFVSDTAILWPEDGPKGPKHVARK
jgi:hypothetical protein